MTGKVNIWCGCANPLDGYVEEVHSYAEAQNADFHHSLYFSVEAAERINNGESVFFWIDNGILNADWRESISEKLKRKIKENLYLQYNNFI